MTTLVIGGAGFVGLNIVERLLQEGASVRLFDRVSPPESALRQFADLPGRLDVRLGDVTCHEDVHAAIDSSIVTIVLGAAITANSHRDDTDPSTVLAVNLSAVEPILAAARDAQVGRVVNRCMGSPNSPRNKSAAALRRFGNLSLLVCV